jgi:hypothetical protein
LDPLASIVLKVTLWPVCATKHTDMRAFLVVQDEQLKRKDADSGGAPGGEEKQEHKNGKTANKENNVTAQKDGTQSHTNKEQASGKDERPAKKAKTEEAGGEGPVEGKPVHAKDLKERLRYVVVGKKALPQVTGKKSRPFWAFVEYVTDDPKVMFIFYHLSSELSRYIVFELVSP